MDPIDGAIALIMVITTAGGVWILGTLARGLVTKWTQPKVATPDTEEIQELRGAISQLAGEVGELHERIDFTERLITANRDT
jgi:hypothetical protein